MCIKKGWWNIGITHIKVVLGAVVTTITKNSIASKKKVFLCNSSGVSSVFYYMGSKGVFNSIGKENN